MIAPAGGLGYAVNDLDGTIVEITPAYAAALGYRVRDLLGRNFRELLTPEFRSEGVATFTASAETGEPSIVRCEYAIPDGSRLSVEVSIMPVRNDFKEVVSMLIVPLASSVTPKLARGNPGLVGVGSAAESGTAEA